MKILLVLDLELSPRCLFEVTTAVATFQVGVRCLERLLTTKF